MGTHTLERWAEQRDLRLTEMSLKSKPDQRHWHLQHKAQRGTIEVTLKGGKFLVQVRANRQGEWTTPAILAELEAVLFSSQGENEA